MARRGSVVRRPAGVRTRCGTTVAEPHLLVIRRVGRRTALFVIRSRRAEIETNVRPLAVVFRHRGILAKGSIKISRAIKSPVLRAHLGKRNAARQSEQRDFLAHDPAAANVIHRFSSRNRVGAAVDDIRETAAVAVDAGEHGTVGMDHGHCGL